MFVHDSESRNSDSRIGLIAGGGQFPLLFAHAARQAGVPVIAVGFEGETDPMLAKYVAEFHMLKLGRLNRLIKTFHNAGIVRAAMAGTINKTRLYTRIRPDWRAVRFMSKLKHKKDDFLLRALADELESEGIRIEPSTMFLPTLLAPEGILTRRKPNRKEQADIEFGWSLAKQIGHLDIGQCLLVRDRAVLAVEGIDGTDATILRGGRLCREGAVVIKVSKPNQDLRFDIPAVGYDTVETMKRVNARVLVVEAERTLMFDREKMIDAADAAGITIWVRKEESASAGEDARKDDTEASHPLELRPTPSSVSDVGALSGLVRKAREGAVRVGVVGVGYLGRFHAQKYARLPEAELVAVVDVDEARLRNVGEEVQAERLRDYRDLIGRVDAVSIVTPTLHHYSIAKDFLSAGVHVLLEKPMTRTLEEADRLVALAEENGCILQIGHLERFNSALRAAFPRIENPMFLEAHRLAMFNERGLEVDVILDLMIHDIDIVLGLIDAPVENIQAAGVSVLTPLPDIATVRMEFANGAVANLTASRISIKNLRKLRIFQENCYLSTDYGNKRAYVVYKEDQPDESGFPQISIEELEILETDALEEEIISFLKSIKDGEKVVVDGHQGRHALAVALDISERIGERIKLGKDGNFGKEWHQRILERR